MRAFGNLFIILSIFTSILFGLEYFSEATTVFLAVLLYLTGHYIRHNFTYRNFKISRRSKPFFESILKLAKYLFASSSNEVNFFFDPNQAEGFSADHSSVSLVYGDNMITVRYARTR